MEPDRFLRDASPGKRNEPARSLVTPFARSPVCLLAAGSLERAQLIPVGRAAAGPRVLTVSICASRATDRKPETRVAHVTIPCFHVRGHEQESHGCRHWDPNVKPGLDPSETTAAARFASPLLGWGNPNPGALLTAEDEGGRAERARRGRGVFPVVSRTAPELPEARMCGHYAPPTGDHDATAGRDRQVARAWQTGTARCGRAMRESP
jgi:hypothetical protein